MIKYLAKTSALSGVKPILATLLLCIVVSPVYAKTDARKAKPVFKIKPGPPKGFGVLAKNPHQNTYVAVFYAGNFVTNAMASFNNKHIHFLYPQKIVGQLKNISKIKRKVLIKSLTGKLAANEGKVCPYTSNKSYCHILHPKDAAVIFNAETYRADLFVNPKYISLHKRGDKDLPNSTANFSFLTQNNIQASKVENYKGYTVSDTSVVADGNNKITTNMGYTETQENGVNSDNFNLAQLAASRYSGGVLYEGGLVAEDTGDFFTTAGIGGVNIKNYGVFTDTQSEVKGSPLTIYLSLPSTVVVKRKGQILAAATLPAGKQQIDTTNFPIGSYDVTLQITNKLGQTTTETRFYVKQESLPQYGKSNFDVSFGVLQKQTFNTLQNQFVTHPSFENVPIFSYHEMRKVAPATGLSTTILSSGARSYISEVLHFYKSEFEVSPGVMISNKFDRGALLNLQYTGLHNSVTLQGMRVWRDQKFNNGLIDLNQTTTTFYPILTNRTQLQGNIAFFDKGNEVNLGGTWFDSFNGQQTRTSSASYTRTIFSNELGFLQLTASLTHENQNDVGLVTLNYNFSTAVIDGNAILHYGNQNATSSGKHKYEPGGGLSLNKNFIIDVNKTVGVSATAAVTQNSKSESGTLNLRTPILGGNFSVTRNQYNQGYGLDNTQYTASAQSSIAYASGHWSMGYGQGLNSGVVVDVSSPKPGSYALYDNNVYLGRFSTNEAHPVFVSSYAIHRFTIQPYGVDIYTYQKNPKETVLYAGNVQYLHWSLERQFLLFGQIVDKHDKPLSNLLLNNRGEFDTTGSDGYIQADITRNTKTLEFNNIKGQTCKVTLPKGVVIKQGVAVIAKPMRCE